LILNQNINEYNLSKKIKKAGLQETLAYIEKYYRESNTIRDGYGMLGNIFRADNQYKKALKLFEKDRCLENLSPAYRHILAFVLARLENCDAAKLEVERAHFEDPSLTCGYHLVDYQSGCLTINVEDLEKVEHQVQITNCDSTRLIDFSRILAQFERWEPASQIIAQAYAIDRNLIDGYAFLGSVLRAYAQFEGALIYYEKDNNLNRLSPLSRIIYAQLLARAGMVVKAENEVQRAYDEDTGLRDGFAFIGTVYRLEMQYDLALKYYEKDRKLEKLSPAQRHIFADQLSRTGQMREAITEIERGYQEAPDLKNGFARVGNVLRSYGKFEDALRFYVLDRRENRLTSWHLCIYAELLAKKGRYKKAIYEIECACTLPIEQGKDRANSNWVSGNTLKREMANDILKRDLANSRISLPWLQRLSFFFAKAGKVQKALCVCEFIFESYPNVQNVFSNLAINIKEIFPLKAKKCFEKDYFSNRQTLSMMVNYLEFLLDYEFLEEAKTLWKGIKAKNKVSRKLFRQKVSSNEKLEHLQRRLKTRTHGFECPAILISFPRSGSNFLQNVISESSGCASASIYSQSGRFNPLQNLTVKSHAIDYDHLQHEMQSVKLQAPFPKVIILFRDPRDVLRSFFEYVNVQRDIQLSPDFFLKHCSYGFATGIPNWSLDRTDGSLTVMEAFKRFVSCWTEKNILKETDVLTVFYEDLCLKPFEAFSSLFEFLNLKCSLNMDAIKKKVALYSHEPNRQRGVAYAWQKAGINSHVIYQLVNESLRDCIEVLGYNLDGGSNDSKQLTKYNQRYSTCIPKKYCSTKGFF
jgi:tetratricopeptide (TPR) repeat protein